MRLWNKLPPQPFHLPLLELPINVTVCTLKVKGEKNQSQNLTLHIQFLLRDDERED